MGVQRAELVTTHHGWSAVVVGSLVLRTLETIWNLQTTARIVLCILGMSNIVYARLQDRKSTQNRVALIGLRLLKISEPGANTELRRQSSRTKPSPSSIHMQP